MANAGNLNRHQEAQQLFIRTLTELSQLSVKKQRYEEHHHHEIHESLYLTICHQMKLVHKKLHDISRKKIRSNLWSCQSHPNKAVVTSGSSLLTNMSKLKPY